jgi:hypothetical protein
VLPVTPTDSKRGTDPTSIGFTFTLSTDEAVTRYGNDYIFLNLIVFRLIIFCLPIVVTPVMYKESKYLDVKGQGLNDFILINHFWSCP